MIGFEVIAPKPVPPERRRKRQRTFSRGILRASSTVAVAARRLAALPFADGHGPSAARAPSSAAGPASSSADASATTNPSDLQLGSTCARYPGTGGTTTGDARRRPLPARAGWRRGGDGEAP